MTGFFFLFFLFKKRVFWLCWVFIAVCRLSLVVASGATLRFGALASYHGGFSCRTQALGAQASVIDVSGLSSCGFQGQLLWHVGSSQTRDQTRVPCIARWILNHQPTREAPKMDFISSLILQKMEGQWLYFFSSKCFANTDSKEIFLGVNEIWKIRQRHQTRGPHGALTQGLQPGFLCQVHQFVVMVD